MKGRDGETGKIKYISWKGKKENKEQNNENKTLRLIRNNEIKKKTKKRWTCKNTFFVYYYCI